MPSNRIFTHKQENIELESSLVKNLPTQASADEQMAMCYRGQGAKVLYEENQGQERQMNPPPSCLSSCNKGVYRSK